MEEARIIAELVVKIGGSTLGQHDTTLADLVALQKQGRTPVVMHGGGKVVTDWQTRLGLQARFVRGLRVTDQTTLEMVIAVLAGLVNTSLVAELNAMGGKAIGLSGADARLIEARIQDPELGLVGEVTRVNADVVQTLLDKGYMPVIAPLGFQPQGANGQPWTMLNINADTAAAEVAVGVKAKQLLFTTDVPGLMDATGAVLKEVSKTTAEKLIADGVATSGMVPKIKACLRAAEAGATAYIIDGRQPGALLDCINGKSTGTTFKPVGKTS